MSKKIRVAVTVLLILFILTFIGGYLGLAYYYKDGFSYGTWINGVYCTGKSIDEVSEELLLREGVYKGLTVTDRDGKSFDILASDVNFSLDFKNPLFSFYVEQNPLLWGMNLLSTYEANSISPLTSFDNDKFENIIDSLPFFEDCISSEDCEIAIKKNDKGYFLKDTKTGHLNKDLAKEKIREAFENRISLFNLEDNFCYENLPVTLEEEKSISLFEKIEEFQNCKIVYQIGDILIPVDSSIACDFIKTDDNNDFELDDNGDLILDEEKLYAFVDGLAQKYDTYGKPRRFQTTEGRIVTVEGGNYGNQIDVEAEKEYLLDAFLNKKDEIHNVILSHEAIALGSDDLGPKYIEVDMGTQHLYYHVDGKVVLDSDIVSGNINNGHRTPEGTYFVYKKQRNATLRGRDYESFVKYWMAVNKAIGIHDASWRRGKFGGEIYKTNGSHGCVNTRTEEMEKLYEIVEVGTPVIMFY